MEIHQKWSAKRRGYSLVPVFQMRISTVGRDIAIQMSPVRSHFALLSSSIWTNLYELVVLVDILFNGNEAVIPNVGYSYLDDFDTLRKMGDEFVGKLVDELKLS